MIMGSDDPIKSVEEDEFGRSGYAAHVAKLINNSHSVETSIVFGLTGAWGSGKTSMLAMIEKELKKVNGDWHIAYFTPWATSDVNGLFADFYSSLEHALSSEGEREFSTVLGEMLTIAAPIAKIIPVVGDATQGALERVGKSLQDQPPWKETFEKASTEIKELNRKILIIADDIDRLQGEELIALLKVVRLLGRFPSVDFLLAYDEKTVTQTLAAMGVAGKGESGSQKFMEKIIQYPLAIPPLLPTQLISNLMRKLDPYLEQMEEPDTFRIRLQQLRPVLLAQLSTPRAIGRYIAQVHHHLATFSAEEIHLGDALIMTLLKTNFRTVHDLLPRYKDQLLTGRKDGKRVAASSTDKDFFNLDDLVKYLPEEDRGDAVTLVKDLFPHIKQTTRFHFVNQEKRKISDKNYFDRYFAMGIPDYDVPDVLVASAISDVIAGDDTAFVELLSNGDADRFDLVINKAEESTALLLSDEERLVVLRTILPLLDKSGGIDSPPTTRKWTLYGWIGRLLSQMSDSADPQAIYSSLQIATDHFDRMYIMRSVFADDRSHAWIGELVELASVDLIETVLNNLRHKNQASQEEGVEFIINQLAEWNQLNLLAKGVEAEMKAGNFAAEDLVARFVFLDEVLTHGVTGREKRLRFDKEKFNQVVPQGLGSWYGTDEIAFEEGCLSWENRKNFAVFQLRMKNDEHQ